MLFQHFLENKDILGIFDVRRELILGIGPRVAELSIFGLGTSKFSVDMDRNE